MLQGCQSPGKYTSKRSYILQSSSYLLTAPLAYMPSPIHAVLVITGWHDQPHFTLLPPMHNRPPSLPLPTTILQGIDLVVLGMQ